MPPFTDTALFVSARHPSLWRGNPGLAGTARDMSPAVLEELRPDLIGEYREFSDATRELWDKRGGSGIRAEVAVVPVVDVAQVDSKAAGKVDLVDELVGLTDLPGAGDFFHEVTAAVPDRKKLRALGYPFHGWSRFEREGMQGRAGVTITHPGVWHESLGGLWLPGEVARSVEVGVRCAKWRDRRVRRLVRASVKSRVVVPAAANF